MLSKYLNRILKFINCILFKYPKRLIVLSLLFYWGCTSKTPDEKPVAYVNQHIGTISHLLTSAISSIYLPHSMVHLAPVTLPSLHDTYLAQKIYGFPIGNATFMPTSGYDVLHPDSCASDFDRDNEVLKPFYFSELLDRYNITCEATVSHQSAIYKLDYAQAPAKRIVFFLPGKAFLDQPDNTTVCGWNIQNGTKKYFYIKFSHPVKLLKSNNNLPATAKITKTTGNDLAFSFDFYNANDTEITIKFGESYIDTEQAAKNLSREIAKPDFAALLKKSEELWNRELGKIQIFTNDTNQKTIFYTAFYRVLYSMYDLTEDDRYFSVFDSSVHNVVDDRCFYAADGTWDSYRAKHPLQLLLNPKQQEDMLQSYAEMYKQYGTMPLFPFPQGELTYMLGNHVSAIALDTWNKGYQNFDLKTIYEGLKKNALERTMLPDVNAPKTELDDFYQENGYFPALNETDSETVATVSPFYRRQAVAVTLEFAYDDYCLSEIAKILEKKDDAELFAKRACNYTNLFNPQSRFMSPKLANGEWVSGFNPMTSGRQGGRDYFAECNSWVYTFHVQHDIAGLINLFGSRDHFINRLDSLFLIQYAGYKFDFQKQFPDMTGLTGMHSQGNEPAFHIPYLYCYAGVPWKTQKAVRKILDTWYFNHPMGLCGDDDDGSLSAWYVFSSLGFYPVCPGMPYYVIGSPLFPKSIIRLQNGREFTIIANNVSKQNKYIQSATLNGKEWTKPWFSHTDIADGGELIFVMGNKPNKLWGLRVNDAPPSMIVDGR